MFSRSNGERSWPEGGLSTVNNHGSIVLITPNTQAGIDWANENIGKDNGYQPYWPTMVFEPRYVEQVVDGIRVRRGSAYDESETTSREYPLFSERKSGFYSGGRNITPPWCKLKKHTQAVHNSTEPVA